MTLAPASRMVRRPPQAYHTINWQWPSCSQEMSKHLAGHGKQLRRLPTVATTRPASQPQSQLKKITSD